MFDDFFYDKVCTIYTVSFNKEDGNTIETKTAILNNIACALRKMKQNAISDTALSRNTDKSIYRLNLDGEYTGISKGDKITVSHRLNGVLQSIGTYTVIDFIPYDDIDGEVDNTSLYLSKLDG